MSATITPTRQKLFGMFELDASNTVLYSRVETDGRGDDVPAADFKGLDLFDGAAPIVNAGKLRRRINDFRSGDAQSDSFDFTCEYEDGPVAVRVLLARVRESFGRGGTKSVLMHVRRKR